jgi:hypothetical protein
VNASDRESANLYFSGYFKLDPGLLEQYGAFDISVVSDLPLFVDPFLLFHSDRTEYQALHEDIVKYLKFLRDKATPDLDPDLIASWYRFKEVKQNWLGFTVLGNGGRGLGSAFARALHSSLGSILSNLGDEQITRGTHLEKLALIKGGVGRDNISDFTTNLIKGFLLEYTQKFARDQMNAQDCDTFSVARAVFNYDTEAWESRRYFLPRLCGDYVILTPFDILTRDDTWISHSDMIRQFHKLPESVTDGVLRAQINHYFGSLLGAKPTSGEIAAAAQSTINKYPELVDHYIREKEDSGDSAQGISKEKREDLRDALVLQVRQAIPDIEEKSDFYDKPSGSYREVLERVREFKDYVENRDGYRVINRGGKPFSKETEVQIFFGLVWYRSEFDVNREVNNGRGPVDFKVSKGSLDKTLIEFKLGSNTALKRNLENQVAIYERANGTRSSVKVIVCYTAEDQDKVARVLRELNLQNEEAIVVIDARSDNKPSASTA